MKKTLPGWPVMAFLFLVIALTSCHEDQKSDNPQNLIKKTWALGASGYIKKDGTDVTTDYTGIVLSFSSNGTYSASNAGKLFFPTGTWAWQGKGTTECVLDGDLPISIKEISKTSLRFTFTLDADHVNPDGRTAAVLGVYEVSLTESN